MNKITPILTATLMAASAASAATIVYADDFDNDGLGTNTGVGGGLSATNGGGNWVENGDAAYNNSGTSFNDSSLIYSTNAFQSDGGFELTVNYTASNTNTESGRNIFGFGLMEDASSWTAANDNSPVGELASVYSIGVHVTREVNRGLNFADGSTLTQLDAAGNIFPSATSTPVVISVLADGLGGADWSYSINGSEIDSGNIASFDFSKSFNFVAYAQDNEVAKSLQSVSLAAIPEPSSYALLAGLLGLSCVMLRRRQA